MDTEEHADGHAPEEIAQKTLEIIPLVMRVMSSEMRRTNHRMIPTHLSLLGILEEGGRYTLGQLAEMHHVSAPTMSNTVTALEERGWVQRIRAEHDRRVVLVELAPPGKAVLDEINAHTRARIAELLVGLDAEQRALLRAGLTVLRDTFAEALFAPRADPPE